MEVRGRRQILVCRVGWMTAYKGLASGDSIHGGGGFVHEYGYGWEVFNFAPVGKKMLGYVHGHNYVINLDRFDAEPSTPSVSGIDVVWVARHPDTRQTAVVGLYKKARVWRVPQNAPKGLNRKVEGELVKFNVEARASDAILIPPDRRDFKFPSAVGRNNLGQSNTFFADDQPERPTWHGRLLSYINRIGAGPIESNPRKARTFRPDRDLIRKIERSAVSITAGWFTEAGYSVSSVEQENLGWDLEAKKRGAPTLSIEVKGTGGIDVLAELTPNEFRAMVDRPNYRLAIVTSALNRKPLLHVFLQTRNEDWSDDHGCKLSVNTITGARVSAA